MASEFITDTILISAYDLYYKHLPEPAQLPCRPEIVFVDSGGYEASPYFDHMAVPGHTLDPWHPEMLSSVLSQWPETLPAVLVSFDHPNSRLPFDQQVENAHQARLCHPDQLHLFLIKPTSAGDDNLSAAIASAIAKPDVLAPFDVIGVTEKELGDSMIARMTQLARFRQALDSASITAPIHVFGALDPLSVCLYYIAGAEIFDGLTWLKYGYHEGRCVYPHNLGPTKYDSLHLSDDQLRTRVISDNYYELHRLKHKMREFESTRDFSKLTPHSELISRALDSLNTELRRRN